MSTSDFRLPMPAPSRFMACRRVRRCATPTDGSPRLTRNRCVRLDAACDPGSPARTRRDARSAVACRRVDTVGRFQLGYFGALAFTVSSTCYHCTSSPPQTYASTGLLPVPAARLDTRPVASGYLGGIRTHSITRPCQVASPQAAHPVGFVERIMSPVASGEHFHE